RKSASCDPVTPPLKVNGPEALSPDWASTYARIKSAPSPIWCAPRTRLTSSENSKSVVLYVLGVSLFDAILNPLLLLGMMIRVSPGTPSQMLMPTDDGEKTCGLVLGTADRFKVARKLLT